jgi:hypothetical protein
MSATWALLAVFTVGAAATYIGYEVRKKFALVNARQKHLARLLLVSGSAFSEENYDLYAAAMREIANIFRNQAWGSKQIERKMRYSLKIAKANTSPESFQRASRLAQAIIQSTAMLENMATRDTQNETKLLDNIDEPATKYNPVFHL